MSINDHAKLAYGLMSEVEGHLGQQEAMSMQIARKECFLMTMYYIVYTSGFSLEIRQQGLELICSNIVQGAALEKARGGRSGKGF